MDKGLRTIELLAPAANADTAIQAILHGADAVYMGGPSHGARAKASNSLEDIRSVVQFAHRYNARVYITVNTIVYEHELQAVEGLITSLYRIGVDAVITQDMGILRMDIPPVSLHASTQCDTRTAAKARFLQDAGFSQIVLARELTLAEIRSITEAVHVPVECFVHGALCVSYSGRCHASLAVCGRSANRGECAQICRQPFTLTDASGKVLARNRHLLSLKDFNASASIEDLMEAGVQSFKIEGRLKDTDYVKNITAYYRQAIDGIIRKHPDKYRRSSCGKSEVSFTPQPSKSFNRGFTDYFLTHRRPASISSPLTPKSMGEVIHDVTQLHNGDGISFFNTKGEYEGVAVNGIRNGKIVGNRAFQLPAGAEIHRTFDIEWQKAMAKPTATRRMALKLTLRKSGLNAVCENGSGATVPLREDAWQPARKPMDFRNALDKFGNSAYYLDNLIVDMEGEGEWFIPAGKLSEARKLLVEALDASHRATYRYDYRCEEIIDAKYPVGKLDNRDPDYRDPDYRDPDYRDSDYRELDYRENVSNSLARRFYAEHGVESIEPALETTGKAKPGTVVMTTRHCVLREMGMCLRKKKPDFKLPLYLKSDKVQFALGFNCDACEMTVSTV